MDGIAAEPDRGLDEKSSPNPRAELSPELLARMQSLYDAGCCRKAFALGNSSVPIHQWRGMDACILAGRIALNLGATRLAFRQHVRAFHSAPESIRAQAYYLETLLAMRGPVPAWEKFRRFERKIPASADAGPPGEGWEYLHTLGARICGHLRDFEQAEERLKTAGRNRSPFPWLLVEQATLMIMQEKWGEASELSRQALKLRPWYRPAVLQLAHCLHTLNQNDEALQLLKEATANIESLPVFLQLAGLQMDLERYAGAVDTLEQAEKFSPIIDKANKNWIAAQQCRAACAFGDHPQAQLFAGRLDDDYHRGLTERLKAGTGNFRRIQLSIPFIQQYRLTCVPATLTMLFRFWKAPAEHVEVAEAICYDGTPSHRARRWAEANGMITREFTVDWNTAAALLDRQIPFAVYTTEAASGHVQVVAGYDELRRTFILRNPAFPQIQEALAEPFLKHYAATGPAGMVLAPASMGNLLEGLKFPDADLFDRLRTIQQALEEHRREDAGALFSEMQSAAPGHWLSLTAGRALYSYDTNTPALMECLNKLLALFPQDGNLSLAKLGILREIGRREDRLEFLKGICARKEADAMFQQQLAQEWMADARQYSKCRLALKRALRLQPLNAYNIWTLANLYWNQRRFEESLEFYRFAACLEETKEPPACSYFAVANARGQTGAALAFLRQRCKRNGAKSPDPCLTWLNALEQIGRPQEALQHLEELLQSRPRQGQLWLAAADAFARHGNLERAGQCLAAAEEQVQRAAFLRVKADLARYRTDPRSALSLWREALQMEPLSVPIHRSLVFVLAETEGREAALQHLEEICGRFPHHYQLRQLWADWARGAGPATGEKVARGLVEIHLADAWARRQLALVLADAGRFEEALAEAGEAMPLAPHDPVSLATRAYVKLNLGRTSEAREDYRAAIRLSVDYSAAIHGLVNSFHTVAERREALAFIEQELVRQIGFGDGLCAYCEAARLNLEPDSLLASLRKALTERPDLATAWSVVIQQLAEMLQLDEALALAREAADRFPSQEQAWQDLSLVHRLRLDTKGEQAALEQAMRISPASSSAARMLAHFYERQGDIPRSKELLEQACARSPLDAFSHGALAAALWQQGDRAAALERMRHALKVFPGYNWGWQTLGSWAAATGDPKLAEELARNLVLQRPGEIRSLLVLAQMLANGRRLEEALQVVNQSLKNFERNAETHELRAELLAALGRQSEADAACEPAVWGARPPAILRACRARLEAQRGNLVSAIERMKALLTENPGYAPGWKNLADWLWQQRQHEEAIAALTNLRRLEPLNPVPLGYLASLKLKQKDRAGAKEDLARALQYDPAYPFASLNLFELQLADMDIQGARQTLKLIERYVGGEKATACEVKLRSKSSLVPPIPTSPGGYPAPTRAEELDQAFARLRDLCAATESAGANLDEAIKALLDAGEKKRVEEFLDEMIQLPDCNPAVGAWWMRRRRKHKKRFCTRRVNRLCPTSAAARRAVVTSIQSLGEYKRSRGRAAFLTHLILASEKFIERQLRGAALSWLAWRHRRWLRSDNHAWASMGYALVRIGRFGSAVRWMRDWRRRSGLKMWMMLNLAMALRKRKKWNQAREALAFAVNLPERDSSFQKIRLLLALELALVGDTPRAAAHFHELNTPGWNSYMLLQYYLTQGLLAVQQAVPAEKKNVFRSERAAIRKAFAHHRTSTFRNDYRRSLSRMAKDTGSVWTVLATRFLR
jgi:tetratricopeptide (TPR) repeat protein